MNDAETQIFLSTCEHVLTLALAEVRMVTAHVAPVAQSLEEGSANRGYLDSSLMRLSQLHGYMLEQLRVLGCMSAEILGNKNKAAMQFVSNDNSAAASTSDADSADCKVH
ncbi:hypothetical protein [Paraburkholderia kururiensis]|uniref:Uncharacterized protein n=1 Tax=Paraburkholderia kururiensis TaxID=984307 RepID=A0ABZ0WS04_9BURK|nr:hypothetical protein [Paraburkholderia kururiensis]WQD80152.1 hypothetical protein U0042_10960 [Paraburkholderia kururiensis]